MSAQRDRVLRALQTAGSSGICQVDFLAPNVVDGGKPITRLAARVMELRQDGHVIEKNGTRHDCAVYRYAGRLSPVLDGGGEQTIVPPFYEPLPIVASGDEPAGLFDPPPANAILGEVA